jgi:hypothetical protein
MTNATIHFPVGGAVPQGFPQDLGVKAGEMEGPSGPDLALCNHFDENQSAVASLSIPSL